MKHLMVCIQKRTGRKGGIQCITPQQARTEHLDRVLQILSSRPNETSLRDAKADLALGQIVQTGSSVAGPVPITLTYASQQLGRNAFQHSPGGRENTAPKHSTLNLNNSDTAKPALNSGVTLSSTSANSFQPTHPNSPLHAASIESFKKMCELVEYIAVRATLVIMLCSALVRVVKVEVRDLLDDGSAKEVPAALIATDYSAENLPLPLARGR